MLITGQVNVDELKGNKATRQTGSMVWRNIYAKEVHPYTRELTGIKEINPNVFIHALSRHSNAARAFITDVGNNQMWTAQSIELSSGHRFLSSGGMGAKGYSLPADIGTSGSLGNVPVVSNSGDGGSQITSKIN